VARHAGKRRDSRTAKNHGWEISRGRIPGAQRRGEEIGGATGGLGSMETAILSSRTAAALHRASGDVGKCPELTETHFGDDQVDRPVETRW
jgi:hypothetical protein